jgi:hypothetical protein
MTRSEAPNASSYRFMLGVVIILGVLIVLSVGALIAAAVLRAGARASAGGSAPFLAELDAPGARIESAEMEGAHILMRLSGTSSGDQLVVLDAASGRVIGRITLDAPR